MNPIQPVDAALFERLRHDFDVIPIVKVVSADTLTPVAAFAAIEDFGEESFLFESVERGESLGRFSFIGFSPRRSLTFDASDRDSVSRLRDELVPLRVYGEESLPPFFGGAVGFFGYNIARWCEILPDRHERASVPDAKLLFVDQVVAFDHLRQRLYVIASVLTRDPRPSEVLVSAAEQSIETIINRLRRAQVDISPIAPDVTSLAFNSNCTLDSFLGAVRRAREAIAAGDIFQAVLSQRWDTEFPPERGLALYRALRSVNPSPYMFLLRMIECTLVGASPEMLVRVQGGVVETRPIAGTRPRGETAREDQRLAEELLADPKENAEHLMLVDLGRNDLGRVCESRTVEVTQFRSVEKYSHVMHIVSAVRGILRKGLTPIEAFLSCFPAGTVSGAPKIRAMEIIDELEPSRRGPYAGAVAYIGFSGNLDSCITIRTVLLANGRAYVQAGAGIVFDSDPQKEYDETISKAAALKRAIGMAVCNL